MRRQRTRGHPGVRHVHGEVALEALGGPQDHQISGVGAPIVRHEQHAVESECVEQGQHVAGDILLRPLVRRRAGPPVAGQVGRDDAQSGRRVGEQVAVCPVMLRPAMQREDRAAVGRTGLGHMKAHATGFDVRPAHPFDRRRLGGHDSDYRELLSRYRAGMGGYRDLFNASITSPRAFWADAARDVTWIREPQQILDDSNPPFYRWFPDGELTTCANALDRHVESGRAEQPALIYDSPVTGSQRTYTYRELLDETARFAGVLRGLGVGKGDRVVIYMPMVPEAVIAMLACARLGAVHSVVFGGFAANELAARIDDARPAAIVTASCGVEPTRTVDYKPMIDAALDIAKYGPQACVIVQRDQRPCEPLAGRDHDWNDVMADAEPVDRVPVAATDPLYVLYTSGTTGRPKGIVRDNGGHAVALTWSM